MSSRGHVYEPATSEHRTDESDCLWLPTPVAQPSGNPPDVHLRKKPGRKRVTDLAIKAAQLATLPTPRGTQKIR
jgi:hypothetical protein